MYLQNFFDVLSTLATWLSIQPHYNVQKCEVWICAYCKIGSILKILVLLIAQALSFYYRIKFQYNETVFIMVLFDIQLSIIECTITILIMWSSAFESLKDWKKCLFLITKQTSCKRSKWILLVRFFVSQGVPLVLLSINGCFWTKIVGFDNYKYFIIGDVERYYNCALFFLYVSFVIQARQEFKNVNNLLIDMTKHMNGEILNARGIVRVTKLHHWSASDISEVTKAYLNNYEFARSINNIFGWKVLLMVAHAVVVMLGLLYSSVWLSGQVYEDSNVTVLLYMNISLTLWSMVSRNFFQVNYQASSTTSKLCKLVVLGQAV